MEKVTRVKNVKVKEGFSQVCVWPGILFGDATVSEFEIFMLNNYSVRVQYLEEIKTKPDVANGKPVINTGGRNDLFFAVKNDDVDKFATSRLLAGIEWIEDALEVVNYPSPIYPKRVFDYRAC